MFSVKSGNFFDKYIPESALLRHRSDIRVIFLMAGFLLLGFAPSPEIGRRFFQYFFSICAGNQSSVNYKQFA